MPINFYKEDGIGKIAFADGGVVALSDDVTVYADDTTNQIVISEFNQVKYWFNTSNTLQVNGVTITGTNQQKATLIAPVFAEIAQSGGVTSYNALTDKPFTDTEISFLKSFVVSSTT